MKLYIDSGNIEEIRNAAKTGLLDGVTTNPSLIAKENKDFLGTVREIINILADYSSDKDFTVSAEVTALSAEEIVSQGRKLSKLNKHILVKVPLTMEGLKATSILAKSGVRVNMTLCFSATQALFAAKAGAFVVSPFIGRLDDSGYDGIRLIKEIRSVYDNYGFKTKILAASIRSTLHVKNAALAGADISTMPLHIFEECVQHSLTEKGLNKFMADWKQYEEKNEEKRK